MASDAPQVTVDSLHADLRRRILSGDFAPGAVLSQVKLADTFGVGRTPLREALRMLQREGLLDAEYNRRVRVAALSTAELEEIYARRIVLEAMALRTSIPRFDAEDLRRLRELLDAMGEFTDPSAELAAWEVPHTAFHHLLVAHAGRSIVDDILQLQDHAERYRAALGKALPGSFAPGAADHELLVECCVARDPVTAGKTLAEHLARAGLALLSQTDPAHDAVALREALRLVVHDPRVAQVRPVRAPSS